MRGANAMLPERPASTVVVAASLDNIRSGDVRFLEEAARFGPLHVRVASDALVERVTGKPPHFPARERRFLASSLRYVNSVSVVNRDPVAAFDDVAANFWAVVVAVEQDDPELRSTCRSRGVAYGVVRREDRAGFPLDEPTSRPVRNGTRRVVVTGCFDWLHSGHLQFFGDAAAFGELYVVVGSDRNIALLKGPGHPLQCEDERRYMVQAARSVHQALISSGSGWMDAEPEIAEIAPDVYVVNEDGDHPSKRDFCRAHGLDYVVLRRRPHRNLAARSSTVLRGF